MTNTPRSLVVYLGYPVDVTIHPSAWSNSLFEAEAAGSPFNFFVSGGRITENLLSELSNRDATERFLSLRSAFSESLPTEMISSIASESADSISKVSASTVSSDLRVLVDLWVLSRSDIYVVDCDLLGRGRCGMEVLYAKALGLKTVGVTKSSSLDPWYHYHLDCIVKPDSVSPLLGEFLGHVILSDAISLSKDEDYSDDEPFEEFGFGD